MQTQTDLVESSLKIMRAGQQPSGAFLACPTFPAYRYSWFRDGTFIAQALDLWEEHDVARAFYEWGVGVILRYRDVAAEATRVPVGEAPQVYLDTRYLPDGSPGQEDWPNFQLDGFGTFLWGLHDHLQRTGISSASQRWIEASEILVDYLSHLWRSPNYDCWEEFPDQVHASTLCALYGGLQAAAQLANRCDAEETALQIRDYLQYLAAETGYLPKFVRSVEVDSSLLWACIPFGVYTHQDPVMEATARKIEDDLMGPYGGMHRYAADSYYGGGEWVLLTALYGEYLLRCRNTARACEILDWIERQASENGELPEQVPRDLNVPHMYQQWVDRGGPPATPLLWSHAAYLRLKHAILHAKW